MSVESVLLDFQVGWKTHVLYWMISLPCFPGYAHHGRVCVHQGRGLGGDLRGGQPEAGLHAAGVHQLGLQLRLHLQVRIESKIMISANSDFTVFDGIRISVKLYS